MPYKNQEDARRNSLKWGREHRDYVTAKKAKPCMDCGISYPGEPYLMEFDHRPGEVKLFELSEYFHTYEKLDAEMAKCDLVCCICHARRTYRRGDHMKGERKGRPRLMTYKQRYKQRHKFDWLYQLKEGGTA